MSKQKCVWMFLYLAVLSIVGYHYQPVATVGFTIVFALLWLGVVLRMYVMSVKAKQESIAKFKARHSISAAQPHKGDALLKTGFFRVP